MGVSMRMHRLLPLALTILLLAAAPSAYAARGFQYGVTAGDVSAKSAVLWAKAKKSGRYTLEVARNRRVPKQDHPKGGPAGGPHHKTPPGRPGGPQGGQRHLFPLRGPGGERAGGGL